MKRSGFTEAQIIGMIKQADTRMPVAELPQARHFHSQPLEVALPGVEADKP